MASSKAASRLPEEQLREREKDGRIRRFILDVLTLRVLGYICAQPASFSFIFSFLAITLTMPPMALYIKNAGELPDLDTMRSWNAYLGKLPDLGLCVDGNSYTSTSSLATEEVASALVDFYIDSDVLNQHQSDASILVAVLTGSQLNTKIKNSTSHRRIDDDVHVTIFIPLTEAVCNSSCTVTGCIDISAPGTATPARHPQIPNSDFTFGTRVLHSHNRPDRPTSPSREGISCHEKYNHTRSTMNMTVGGKCRDVRPHREKYRKHGLITIYLSEEQKQEAYMRILTGTFGVAAIGLAFAVGIGCTERPPKPKNRPE